MMGKIMAQLVVTGSERRGRPKGLQPGNREWATLIAAINAGGWAILPFLILTSQYNLSARYEDAAIPREWATAVSDNGWTNNKLGIEWLKHFDLHTKTRTVGAHRLLVLDGHKNHNSLEFQSCARGTRSLRSVCRLTHLIYFSLLMLAASRHLSARTAVRLRASSATTSTTSLSLSSSPLSRQRTTDLSRLPTSALPSLAQVLSHTSQTQSCQSLTYSCVRLRHHL
jgi:hypothetical protein